MKHVVSLFDLRFQLGQQVNILVLHFPEPCGHLLDFIPEGLDLCVHAHVPRVQDCCLEAEGCEADAEAHRTDVLDWHGG
jgi:hypothetical protein